MSNILIPTGNFIKSSCTTAYFTLQFDVNKTKQNLKSTHPHRQKTNNTLPHQTNKRHLPFQM